jgi:hypothetical protein
VSYQTTIARAEAAAWETQWKRHRAGCPRCSAAANRRRWHELCDTGAEVRAERTRSATTLKRERELDRLPVPVQGALW